MSSPDIATTQKGIVENIVNGDDRNFSADQHIYIRTNGSLSLAKWDIVMNYLNQAPNVENRR